MEPTFKKGVRIGIRRLKKRQVLKWGRCYYMIDKNLQASVSRIYKGRSRGCFLLVSDNPNKERFPPVERRKKELEAILEIVAAFTKF